MQWAIRVWLMLPFIALCCGCSNGPFVPRRGQSWQQQGEVPAHISQLQEAQGRVEQLASNNQDLTAQLAQAKQQERLARDETKLVKQQLQETVAQLKQQTLAFERSEQRLSAIQTSNRRHGAATIRANNSVTQKLQVAEIPGYRVFTEGDVVRIEIPADEIFQPSTAQMKQGALSSLDSLGAAVARQYGQQRIAIEGHTDSSSGAYRTVHQLAIAQAEAVFQQLTRRGRLQARQLTVMGQGNNHPRYSNATDRGRAANRRIELVIYPETLRE